MHSPLRSFGYATIVSENGLVELDTTTCGHCNSVTHIVPGKRPEDIGGYCPLCDKFLCPKCAGGPCVPFEKKLEAWEASYHARRSYGF